MSTTRQDGGPGTAAGRQVASAAAEQAGQVSEQAATQTKEVAGAAAQQARQVGQEATVQARGLLRQTKEQAQEQAENRTQEAAAALTRLSDQARALIAGRHEEAGSLPQYAEDVVSKVEELAGRVQHRGFAGVMADVQRYARRRPGVFLLGAAAVGFGTGRLLRSGAVQQVAGSHQPQTGSDRLPVPVASEPAILATPAAMDLADVAPPVTPPPDPPAQAAVGPDWAGR